MLRVFIFIILIAPLFGGKYEEKLSTLYDSLNPNSLTEQFAFYSLYPDVAPGKEALKRSLDLINKHRRYPVSLDHSFSLPSIRIEPILALITKPSYEPLQALSKEELQGIQRISNHLFHNKLKGHSVTKLADLPALSSEEIDIARAIFLYQFGEEAIETIETYEGYLDIMALQILAKLPKNPTFLEKQEAMNQFIFHEMRYRFPPHSMWAKEVDLYTFLPSVLDGRHGVCLGVSILYLSLAQRLYLPLEIITPPGHIFLSYQEEGTKVNIETTARGIHMPDEAYLGINTKLLEKHALKEVVGLHFMNAAGTAWTTNRYDEAIKLYKEAEKFLPDYPLLQRFLGYSLLFSGKIDEGTEYLKKVIHKRSSTLLYEDTLAEDYLEGKASIDAMKAVYLPVDETRESILEKQIALQKQLKECPSCREVIFHLAITHLQLGASKEALQLLERYHALDPNNPTAEYYLSLICMERYSYPKAASHLRRLEEILEAHHHTPKAFLNLKESFRRSVRL